VHLALGELLDAAVGVLRRGGDREMTLDQPGQRTDQLVRHPADQLRAQQH